MKSLCLYHLLKVSWVEFLAFVALLALSCIASLTYGILSQEVLSAAEKSVDSFEQWRRQISPTFFKFTSASLLFTYTFIQQTCASICLAQSSVLEIQLWIWKTVTTLMEFITPMTQSSPQNPTEYSFLEALNNCLNSDQFDGLPTAISKNPNMTQMTLRFPSSYGMCKGFGFWAFSYFSTLINSRLLRNGNYSFQLSSLRVKTAKQPIVPCFSHYN